MLLSAEKPKPNTLNTNAANISDPAMKKHSNAVCSSATFLLHRKVHFITTKFTTQKNVAFMFEFLYPDTRNSRAYPIKKKHDKEEVLLFRSNTKSKYSHAVSASEIKQIT